MVTTHPSLSHPAGPRTPRTRKKGGWEGPGPTRQGHTVDMGPREKGDLSKYKLCPTEVGVGTVVVSFWTGSISTNIH